jgi:hypothetical protein
VEFEEEW